MEEEYTEDRQFALDDKEENVVTEDTIVNAMVSHVMEKYVKAEDSRRIDEERWLRAYRNYRGIYGPDVQFTEAEKSRVFIKVTKTKVLAAYNQITDVLFSNNTLSIELQRALNAAVSSNIFYVFTKFEFSNDMMPFYVR